MKFNRTILLSLVIAVCCQFPGIAQDTVANTGDDTGAARIIIQTDGPAAEPPPFYRSIARASASVQHDQVKQVIEVKVNIVQGKPGTITFGLNGDGDVKTVDGDKIVSWSVRRQGTDRYLDMQVDQDAKTVTARIMLQTPVQKLPAEVRLLHLAPGDSVGFDSLIDIEYEPRVSGTISKADGFVPLATQGTEDRLQSATGGDLTLRISRRDASLNPIELANTALSGALHANGKSVKFQLKGVAHVTEPNVSIAVLSGHVAVSQIPASDDYQLRLTERDNEPVYEFQFSKTGSYPIELDFVASLKNQDINWRGMEFQIATSAVVPITLREFDSKLDFLSSQDTVVPIHKEDSWIGYLPATGKVKIVWKDARSKSEGKLFFKTSAQIDTTLGPGLLRQSHLIDYQVLQGQLDKLELQLRGPGEIVNVQGPNIVGWTIDEVDGTRSLNVSLSQPMTGTQQIAVTSQNAVGAFPVRVDALRLVPIGAIRHSGYVRITNSGSVRIDPVNLEGLSQLAPDQFPGAKLETRQTFAYRFPAAAHNFAIAADRIQPEVSVAELTVYRLSESDRVMSVEAELDIREAAIREWDFGVPEDYSIVSVSGAAVGDYVAASQAVDGVRNLKVLFAAEVRGRHLVTLLLEKNEIATAGEWLLPRIRHPNAKSVRGAVGVVGAPGYRIAVSETEMLVEKPLSTFPKQLPNLQQSFRVREPDWSAKMRIEPLERGIQSDVFHLYSLSQGTIYGSALINYFVTGAPTAELQLTVPSELGNVVIDGRDVRTWRREGDDLYVSLHQPVMGAYTLLVTFEQKPNSLDRSFRAGVVAPVGVQSDRGYVQVVSPMQVALDSLLVSSELLVLDSLELPAEFRLLSTAPALGTWQYTARPFDLRLKVDWFEPGLTATQIVEFSEASSRVSPDGELVTDVVYYVKSRGEQTLRIELPEDPVRLWAVTVNGRPVTARQADDDILIPLPSGADPNIPVEVTLRLGKPAVDEDLPALALPVVYAPVLKTQWSISGDENHVLVPVGQNTSTVEPILRPTGFETLAHASLVSIASIAFLVVLGVFAAGRGLQLQFAGVAALLIAVAVALLSGWQAFDQIGSPSPLQLSLPVVSAGESIGLQVKNVPTWSVNISWVGVGLIALGLLLIGWTFTKLSLWSKATSRVVGFAIAGCGILLQRDGTPWFFAFLAIGLALLLLIPAIRNFLQAVRAWRLSRAERRKLAVENTAQTKPGTEPNGGAASVATTALMFLLATLAFATSNGLADEANSDVENRLEAAQQFAAANSLIQNWDISKKEGRLLVSAEIEFSGQAGNQFLLLRAPAVLTNFEGADLRLSKTKQADGNLAYIVTIPFPNAQSGASDTDDGEVDASESEDSESEDSEPEEPALETETDPTQAIKTYQAKFDFLLEAADPQAGIPVLTGAAAVQKLEVSYDEVGWEVSCSAAASVEPGSEPDQTSATILLGPGNATIVLQPRARDIGSETTEYFVEGSNLYIPGPGVVDGVHRLRVRASQGRVRELTINVPDGLTVSSVDGPVESWQFDADARQLLVEIESSSASVFDVGIETQRGLDPLPAELSLEPLKIVGAVGEVGLLAVGFGSDAQPESIDSTGLSLVNLGDFDSALLEGRSAVVHRVYRYGADGGNMQVRVVPVEPEIRVLSRQVLSLGDERVALAVNFAAEISRAGLFQLSFPLPDNFEVESLTGDALDHWAELSEEGERRIVLHLKGKTIGTHTFSLTLAGAAPTDAGDWSVPRFQVNEAERHTGDLVIRPSTGVRLRTVSRQNVSEADPRELGGQGQGALAFRLLQSDWELVLGIEKLEPWLTGQVLHEVTIREGQTRSTLVADFQVQNASIRSLQVTLPITDPDEIKTLRASGSNVADFVRTSDDSNVWELQFKRRIIGRVQFQIEYERRGERSTADETLSPIQFPGARQLSYFYSVRAGGRLELQSDELSQGWQRADWNTVPQALRDTGNRNAPALSFRAMEPQIPLTIRATRHSLAEALKLRVASGTLTTVLSPTGDQLTAVDVTMEVIQRSSLSVQLPLGGELFNIFVNGESVHSIRRSGNENAWQFYILPGFDDRTANVRFVYSLTGSGLANLELRSPQLDVPLENVKWNVIAPTGFELASHDGNLELIGQDRQSGYDRKSYLTKARGKRQVQAQQAAELLQQANQLLQSGQQSKARWAFNSVANQYALDAASNEDARVQLENLQTQQAIVGLNTRRQRLFLDNNQSEGTTFNDQYKQAASTNPILQQEQVNFRPQELSQLLGGNTTEDNAVLQQIAGRLVQHQRTTEPAPQAIIISIPEEGNVYSFSRTVQVAESAPLELDLKFTSRYQLHAWQWGLIGSVLLVLVGSLFFFASRAQTA